jgi:hypothetical protein
MIVGEEPCNSNVPESRRNLRRNAAPQSRDEIAAAQELRVIETVFSA